MNNKHKRSIILELIREQKKDAETFWSMGNGIDAGKCNRKKHDLQRQLDKLT